MIELVCIDLDGTLLDDEKKISESDLQAIEELQIMGVNITIFTGRSFHSALPYVNRLDIKIPVVFQNGALICSPDGKRIYRQVWLPSTVADRIVELSRQSELYAVVYDDFFNSRDMYVESAYHGAFDEYFRFNSHRTNFVEDLREFLSSRESVVEVALVGPNEKVEELVEELYREFQDQFTPVKNREINGTVFLEIFGKNVGKEIAIDFVLNLFHTDPLNIVYIGDNYNDLEIMKKVGYSIAMGNAPEEVKKAADFITLTNNNSGVAYAIERIILEKLKD